MHAKNNWKDIKNQRAFLESVALKLGITKPEDWSKVSVRKVEKIGGQSLIRAHSHSLFKTLVSVYKEISWEPKWFSIRSNKKKYGYWNISNSKDFLLSIQNKYKIERNSDWGKLTIHQIEENGGRGLLNKHKRSLISTLKFVFPEIEWKREWFNKSKQRTPRSYGYWKSIDNQKRYLEELYSSHSHSHSHSHSQIVLKNHSDLAKLTLRRIRESGGSSLLNYYNHSLYKSLCYIYSDKEWKREWFIKESKWKDILNRKNVLLQFATQNNIKILKDWGNIKVKDLMNNKDLKSLIYRYDCSLFKLLTSTFPEEKWNRDWFVHLPRFPREHWNDLSNQRSFMDAISSSYNLQNPKDWQRISSSLIKRKGGSTLLAKYNSSLIQLLKTLYPFHNWDLFNYQHPQSIPQQSTLHFVKKLI